MRTSLEAPPPDRLSPPGNPTANVRPPVARSQIILQLPFALAIFLSAFLLFQVQLLLGKQILPLFGGAPAVWTTCLLVFQLLLLAGYAYAHGVAAHVSLRWQLIVQFSLFLLSAVGLVFLSRIWPTPISPGATWHTPADGDPTWTIVKFLLAAVGLPFFLLSITSPLLQHWLARSMPRHSPYRLYALSNAGSLLALLSYPFLVEPNLRLRTQAWIWVAGYAAYLAACIVCAATIARSNVAASSNAAPLPTPTARSVSPLGWALPSRWICLAACASTLLLATTNLICQEVAVIPFLWVLPLSLYLLSFILCFESVRWYRRAIFQPLFAVAVGFVILVSLPNTTYSYLVQLAAYSTLLFAGCMVCHGEAACSRPAPESLTAFYLCIAAGGAVGGIFVSLLAPRIFPGYWEFPLGALAGLALVLSLSRSDPFSWWHTGRLSLALSILAGVVLLAPAILTPVWGAAAHLPWWSIFGSAGALLLGSLICFLRERRRSASPPRPFWVRVAARTTLALLTAGLAITQKAEFYNVQARSRNFYGVLSVVASPSEGYLALRHGKTMHGFQFQDPARAHLATGYYGPKSGANAVITNWPLHPMRVGLVGMGVGTLATLAQPGDVFRFYEINPDVYKWSAGNHPYFTYLRDSRATVEVVLGDGRLSLEREAARGESQNFDLLVLDAFSSDAIPMHLLTREAFLVYATHLRSPKSVIAVHISNNTLDLRPVLAAIAGEFHFHALQVTPFIPRSPFSESNWVLLSRDAASLAIPDVQVDSQPLFSNAKPLLWTDDYCNLLRVLRPRE